MIATGECVVLQPFELADLLGVDRADVGVLVSAAVRVSLAWVEGWRNRRGALELTTEEAAFFSGVTLSTVQRWCQGKKCKGEKLSARRSGGSLYRISPAALVAFLKRMAGGDAPRIVETPTQRDRRAQSDKEATRAILGAGRRKPKAA